jgi:hypothetical protein
MGYADLVTSVLEDPGPLKIGIYGEPGCGKTILACQAPKPLLLDVENGRRSLLNHKELWNTGVRKISTYAQAEETVNALRGKDPYFNDMETIILDTISRLQQKHLVEELKVAVAKNQSRHPYLPSEAEFNISNRVMERYLLAMIEACAESDKTLIVNCHVKEDKDDAGQTILIRPMISPGLVGSYVGLMDAVFYMSEETDSKGVTTRKLRTVASRKTKGKNRLGNLPVEMINPTFQQILDAANEQREIALSNQ